MSIFDRQRNGPQHSNTSSATATKDSAANFNFLGGQQQISAQQPGLMQSLARQQSGLSDAQMLQQQMSLKQMQEFQRQQQIQQIEAMHRNTINQMPLFSNQAAGNPAASFINGSPMHEASNYPWSSQVMSGSPNWLQPGASPAMQGYSNGVMMPPMHGHSVHMMGLNLQQVPPSLYGVPVSSARSESGFLMNQADKPMLHQVPLHGNISDNQHPLFAEQMNMRGGITVSRQGFDGKGSFEYTSRQGLVPMNMENLNEMKQRSLLASDGRQGSAVTQAPSLTDPSKNQAASSQAPVGLDPTEEKILFGDDDNIWEAFGGSLSESTAGVNHFDGALPSLQSGSWSALMQSAVAESAGSDTVVQEEWRGAGVQNSGSLTGKQPPKFLDSGEQPASWFDRSSMAQVNSRPSPDTSLGPAFHNSGLQKSLSNQGREGLSRRSSQQTSEEGNKWSDHKQPRAMGEGSQSHESDYGFGSKTPITPWSHQQRTSSLENRPGALNLIHSSNHGIMSRDQEKFMSSDGDSVMNLNVGDGGHKSSLRVGPDSSAEMQRHHINTMDDIHISDNHQQEFWRSDVKSGVDGFGKYQQHLNKGIQRVLHSSTNSYDRGTTEIPETGSSDKRENSSDSYSSNLSNRASSGRMRENVWLDAGDTPGMSGGKQISCSQGDIRVSYGISPSHIHSGYASATTNFDRSGGISTSNTPITSSQNMLELLHKVDQSKDHTTLENFNSSDCNRQSNANEPEASGRNAAFSPGYSFSSQGFGLQLAPPSQGLPAPNFVVPSQNISHNVNSPSSSYLASDKGDKSHAWLTQAGSGQSLSSVHDAQQMGAQTNRSDNVPWHIHESLARNMQGNFAGSFPAQSQHSKNLLHNQQFANAALKVNQQGNASFDWQAPQDKQMTSAAAQRVNAPSPSTDHSDAQVQLQQMTGLDASSTLQPSITSDMYQKGNLSSMIPNLRTDMTQPQQLLSSQTLNAADLFKNNYQLNNILETSAFTKQKQESQDTMKKGHTSQSLLDGKAPMNDRHADEHFASSPSDASVQNSAATKEDIQAFGRSLKPNSNTVDNYSLLHQMQTRKEMDPRILQAKRFKGLDNDPDGLSHPDKKESSRINSISSLDANIPNFIQEPVNDQEQHIQQQSANAASQDLSSGQGEPQKLSGSNLAASIAEHSQISLQMAPTWFKQFGTFKNGQLTPVHGLQRDQPAQTTDQQIMISKSSEYLATKLVNAQTGQNENVWQNVPQIPTEHIPANLPLASTITSLRPKKRKRDVLDLLPWHKEVTLGDQTLSTISSSEEDWAQSSQRVVEKVEDETDVHEDVSPVVRSRKRLMLTTQLMQQIFCPPPASLLSLDDTKELETVAYFTARSALAEACSLTCQLESDSCVNQDKEKLPCKELKANDGRIRDQHLKKVMEQFINRAKNIDNDLLRLDKRLSVLDLRLDCQDLEKFSVINRFAKFHGRGQGEGADASSLSSDAIQRARPQRYVNAYNAPKNLPDRVQCLSL